MLENTEIDWQDHGRGFRLREKYYRARGIQPSTRQWKRIDPIVRAALLRRWQFKTWLTALFACGRLDGFRIRR